MYNQEIKERFLAEYTAKNKKDKSVYTSFENIGIYESQCQKDIATMSVQEAIAAINHVHIGTYRTATTVATVVKAYTNWCLEHGVFADTNPNVATITIEDIDCSMTIKKTVFRDEAELIRELKLARPFDDGYYEVVAILFLWLGIELKKMLSIKIEDVDLQNNVVYLRDQSKEITFSNAIGDILRVYASTKSGTRMARSGPREVRRDDSFNHFIRKFAPLKQLGEDLTIDQMEDAISLANKAYVSLGNEPRFTSSIVARSGALYRLWQLEQTGVDVFSAKNKELVKNTFAITKDLNRITWLYRNYKRAFSL